MNIYARYFDEDVLVHSFDELMAFLKSIPEIPVNANLESDIRAYVESDMPYPKRYKIRPRVYFILIKTTAQTIQEFKNNRKDAGNAGSADNGPRDIKGTEPMLSKKEIRMAQLAEEHFGWYLCSILFKRVIQIGATNKFQYQDTPFKVYVQAHSGNECYNRIVEHLKRRPEIDTRSQYPSARGSNFGFEYVGEERPIVE